MAIAPKVSNLTQVGLKLRDLPPPAQSVDIAIYAFPDLTGQYKESDTSTEYSRAVTQGAGAFLVDALQQAGNGRWFNVVERAGLQNLLQERQIIATTLQQYDPKATGLPPLRFAGIILEGGIVGYDTNTSTGGAGAKFLGVGGDAKYRKDVITVSLRAISVQTGLVLDSVTTTKTIYSIALQGGAYRYVALNELLEIEAGVTRNEPTTIGVREAVEVGVMALIVDGVRKDLWQFQDRAAGERVVQAFIAKEGRGSRLAPSQVAAVNPVVAQAPSARKPTASQQAATDRVLAASNETAADTAAARRRANTVAGADENAPVRRGPTAGNL
ncbi:CsgG/HfaB family protein [Aureimonas pseudogalii]|uniref:Curli production assembly/transport component CsgG n=1 Tax=Aureimonas pseudogalii TaxID=1744844 RepID=A0A7W6H7W6_9HYPH|nr:CsgG/HfaB family protein [Aureimonas pseudogalii]MBB4000221.1 curli production assembly/transport component CsgG [Aureimonas pseudogalii]